MDELDPWAPVDPLGRALHLLRMNGAFYCRSELTAPWGMSLPPMPGYLWFHVLIAGDRPARDARRASPRSSPRASSRSCPAATGHVLRSEPGAPRPGHPLAGARADRRPLRGAAPRRRRRADRAGVRRGAPRASRPPATSSARCPRRSSSARAPPGEEWIQSSLRLLAAEARHPRPGGEAVITRLGGHHRHPGPPRVDGERPRRAHRLARSAARPVHRQGDRARARRPGPRLDRCVAGRRALDVTLRVRGALHRARRRAGDAVRDPLADARRLRRPAGRRRRPSRSSPTGSATAPRRPSRARSSASPAPRPARCAARPIRSRPPRPEYAAW